VDIRIIQLMLRRTNLLNTSRTFQWFLAYRGTFPNRTRNQLCWGFLDRDP
jgi:hypothetical protein